MQPQAAEPEVEVETKDDEEAAMFADLSIDELLEDLANEESSCICIE